jgi:hypothetical protein
VIDFSQLPKQSRKRTFDEDYAPIIVSSREKSVQVHLFIDCIGFTHDDNQHSELIFLLAGHPREQRLCFIPINHPK